MTDLTQNPDCLYGSLSWCALRLGRSVTWLRQNEDKLTRDGFPKIDPIVGFRVKADVDAWINHRRRLEDRTMVFESTRRENYNGL